MTQAVGTQTLAEFLLARIAEDEEVARSATRDSSYGWSDNAFTQAVELAENEGAVEEATAHIARHNPARVLAECEAKRRIVTRWEFAVGQASNADEGWEMIAGALEDCVCDLALPYVDHPDFREEWQV
jgi:hypothetical protein